MESGSLIEWGLHNIRGEMGKCNEIHCHILTKYDAKNYYEGDERMYQIMSVCRGLIDKSVLFIW